MWPRDTRKLDTPKQLVCWNPSQKARECLLWLTFQTLIFCLCFTLTSLCPPRSHGTQTQRHSPCSLKCYQILQQNLEEQMEAIWYSVKLFNWMSIFNSYFKVFKQVIHQIQSKIVTGVPFIVLTQHMYSPYLFTNIFPWEKISRLYTQWWTDKLQTVEKNNFIQSNSLFLASKTLMVLTYFEN